jgi:hypothetical protein
VIQELVAKHEDERVGGKDVNPMHGCGYKISPRGTKYGYKILPTGKGVRVLLHQSVFKI